MEPIISVRGLGKSYRIQTGERKPYRTLRDDIADFGKGLLKGQWGNSQTEEFWALKDIDFDIYPGEVVGIIGRNGAGKSTLLKVLSRVVQPTTGEAILKGRVASLLEVGTGFHPELTGQENIYMSGAILGMRRDEIKRQFNKIVEFAEIDKFLDTPVKRFSSGMYVRLAFAVAAHLESEILIIDEVLAVGDIEFQRKCLGKMEDVAKDKGRTVLFVSHNMSSVQTLCKKCIVLDSGSLIANDFTSVAAKIYLNDLSSQTSFNKPKLDSKNPKIISGEIELINNGDDSEALVNICVESLSRKTISLDLRLTDSMGVAIAFGSLGTLNPDQLIQIKSGKNFISFIFMLNYLAIGNYHISLDLTMPDQEYFDRAEKCLDFEVIRPAKNGNIRVLNQSWNYGSFEIPLTLK
jgi:lipopolysaccharide transport system ATP-binding protein